MIKAKNSDLQPHLLCRADQVAPYVLLPEDPGRVGRMAKLLEKSVEISYNREFHLMTGFYKGLKVSICSTGIGGPSTAIAMEELINCGAKVFIRVGSCGGNDRKIKVNDLIISDSVIREDHALLDYVPLQYPAIADYKIVSLLEESAKKLKARAFVGPTVSVDALYSPATKERKEYWKKFGALAQDMEAGTVLGLARLKGMKAGSILLVVDQEGEKNLKAKIAAYSLQAKNAKGVLIENEALATKIALETLLAYAKENK